MPKAENISMLQAILIIIGCRLTTGYVYLPLSIPPANQDIWIMQIFSSVYIVIISIPLLYLSNHFPELTLIQYTEKIMGKYIGKFIGTLYIAFILLISVLVLSEVTIFILTAIMPETPAYAIMIFALAASVYGSFKGIETIGRTAELFVPYIIFVIFLFFILGFNDMNLEVFRPVYKDSGFQQINEGAFYFSSRFYEVIILCMIVPNLKNKKDLNKIFTYSVVLFILLLILITIPVLATMGIQLAKNSNFPHFYYAKLIDLFDFIQRIESLNVIGWFLVELLKLSTYLYVASVGMKQVFNVKSNKKFLIPLAGLVFLVSLSTKLKKFSVISNIISYKILSYIGFVFILVIPMILLMVYLVRKKLLHHHIG